MTGEAFVVDAQMARRFDVQQIVSVGRSASVFRAVDQLTGAEVAVKVVRESERRQLSRLVREAIVLSEISHPAVVAHVAHGHDADGRFFVALEWVRGETLAARLSRGALSSDDAVEIGWQVAGALAAVHARGIIHRDIKPANLMLVDGRCDRVKLIDFGIAKLDGGTRTVTGELVGTPGYIAPEQATGHPPRPDVRIDVFALGCVLYECLAGRVSAAAENFAVLLARAALWDPRPLSDLRPDVPPELEGLIMRTLARSPADRPGGAAEVLEALRPLRRQTASRHSALPTFGSHERRLVAVVALTGLDDRSALVARCDETASLFGGDVSVVPGAWLASFAGDGTAKDRAAQAASCALALKSLAPHVTAVVAMAQSLSVDVAGSSGPFTAVRPLLVDCSAKTEANSRVRIDAMTAAFLDARFKVEAEGARRFLVSGRPSSSQHTLLGKAMPCLGRDRELAAIEALIEESFSEPLARAVLVTGEAGVGKSRLVAELLRRTGPGQPRFEVWSAVGSQMHAGSPFRLVRELLASSLGLTAAEPTMAVEKLRLLAPTVLPATDVVRASEFLSELLAPGGNHPQESVQIRAARQNANVMAVQIGCAWNDWLRARARQRPLLLVIDDFHWGDQPSAKLIDAALRDLPDERWMVLALARPELCQTLPDLWKNRRLHEIRLSGLSRRASESLVQAALGDLGAERIAALARRADGNAFYLEELIRGWVANPEENTFPETLLAMVEGRLLSLPVEARRVLRAGAIYGSTFSAAGCAEILGGAHTLPQWEPWLDLLVEKEVLQKRTPVDAPAATAEYAFVHELLREAVYNTLTETDRSSGHRMAGRWLEGVGGSDPMALAEHHARGGEPALAVPWFRAAAERALAGTDAHAARARVERALEINAGGTERGLLRLLQAEATLWDGQLDAAGRASREALANLPSGGTQWYSAFGVLLQSADVNDHEEISQAVQELAAQAPPEQITSAHSIAWARALRLSIAVGRYADARVFHDRLLAVDPAVARKDPEAVAMTKGGLFYWLTYVDWDPWGRLLRCLECGELFARAGDLTNALMAKAHEGWAWRGLGQLDVAERTLRETLAVAEDTMSNGLVAPMASLHLAAVLLDQGRFDEALAAQSLIREDASGAKNWPWIGMAHLQAAVALLGKGASSAARSEARSAVERLSGVPAERVRALAVLSTVSQGREDVAQLAEKSLEALNALPGVPECDPFVRGVYMKIGATPRAEILTEGLRRLTSAGIKIPDPRLRRQFLAVPDHAALLTAAKSQGIALFPAVDVVH